MNYEALTTELSNLYLDLKAGKIEPKLAHELNNTAVNIQSTIRLGLLNAKLKGETPDLKFFKTDEKPQEVVPEKTQVTQKKRAKCADCDG